MSPTGNRTAMACLQSKGSIPWFLNYSKTLNSGVAPEIDPATIRSADKRRTAWATPAAVITRRGGGGWSIKFYAGRIRPEVGPTPYPFTYHFWQKRYPFPTPSFNKWYPFLITNLEFCIPINQCKGTPFKIWINHKIRMFFRLFYSLKINL